MKKAFLTHGTGENGAKGKNIEAIGNNNKNPDLSLIPYIKINPK